jgi:hypothetical protein
MDDAYPSERDDARQLIESCPDCAALAADIRMLAGATSQLPAPKRTRDFTITPQQADKLRGSGLSRWLRGFSTPGWGALRPVAGAALSIGIVMVVVGAALPHSAPSSGDSAGRGGTPAAAAATAAPERQPIPQAPGAAGQQESTAPVTTAPGTLGAMVAPLTSSDTGKVDQPGDFLEGAHETENPVSQDLNNAYAQSPEPGHIGGDNATPVRNPNTTSDLLIYGGLAIALISAVVLGLAWFARRRFADPLLR